MFFVNNPKGLLIYIKVNASSKQTNIKEYVAESPTKGFLKVSLQAPPEKNLANKSLIKLLAQEWNIPIKDITILHGATTPYKTILIQKKSKMQEPELLEWAKKLFLLKD